MVLMKRIFKRFIGVILTAVLVVTASGCADTGIALTIDGNDLKAGEYIYTQFTALGSALSKFEEEYPDLDTTVVGFDYYKYNIEGVPFRDWVVNETVNICAKCEAYAKLFNELGLEFTDEEKNEHKTTANNAWTVEDSYLSYYGIDFSTWGAYYESVGISKSSFQRAYENDAKAEKVFHAYYDKGGEFEVSEETLLVKFAEEYARYRMLSIELTDADGNALTDTAAINELEDLAESYKNRIASGEKFSVISEDYDTFLEQRDREAHPENYEEDEAIGNLDEEEADEEAEETAEEETGDIIYDKLITKASTSPSEEIVAHIFGMEMEKPEVYKTEDAYYVIVRSDITEREDWFESYRETLLHLIKSEEMLDKATALAETLSIEKNQAALDRYEPKKLM